MSNGTHDIFCEKCESELLFISPNAQLTHIGTDYWTVSGQRIWKPLICMACRTKIGQHAKKEQDKQIVKAETDKHVQILNNILQGL